MTATMATTPRWETRPYRRIASARFRDPHLVVVFEDGSEVSVAVDRFDNPYLQAQQPDWSRVQASAHHLVVPTATGEVGIPWDSIRRLTDADFEAHWLEMAAAAAQSVGNRMRELRERHGLSPADLAARAGTAVSTVSDVEAGRHSADISLLDRVLAAMGCTSADLIDERDLDAD